MVGGGVCVSVTTIVVYIDFFLLLINFLHMNNCYSFGQSYIVMLQIMGLDGACSWSSFLLHSMYAICTITIAEFRDSTIFPLAAGTSGIEIGADVSSVR